MNVVCHSNGSRRQRQWSAWEDSGREGMSEMGGRGRAGGREGGEVEMIVSCHE